MISVFQIFRVLLGVIVFIFVITFFIRVSEMYTSTQEMGLKIEQINSFGHSAMSVYTSGNPTTFDGFKKFETLVYEAPKFKSDAGTHTLLIPVFLVVGSGRIGMERRCLEYGWYDWCSVFAFPDNAKVLFTPLDNTPESRALILEVADMLPAGMEIGFCNGTDARTTNYDGFVQYMSGAAGKSYEPCDVNLPGHYRLVTVSTTTSFSPNIAGNHIIIERTSGTVSDHNYTGQMQSRHYAGAYDILVSLTGGIKALEFKNAAHAKEISAAASIIRERSLLVAQKVKAYNIQPCSECSTPVPKECGWTDHLGNTHDSQAYKEFIASLALLMAPPTSQYESLVQDSALKYAELENAGCE